MIDIFFALLIPYPGTMIAPFLVDYVLKLMLLFFLHHLMKMHPRHAVKEASAWADLCYRGLPFAGSHARKKRSAPGIITAFHEPPKSPAGFFFV